jgi:hypothetical protein
MFTLLDCELAGIYDYYPVDIVASWLEELAIFALDVVIMVGVLLHIVYLA